MWSKCTWFLPNSDGLLEGLCSLIYEQNRTFLFAFRLFFFFLCMFLPIEAFFISRRRKWRGVFASLCTFIPSFRVGDMAVSYGMKDRIQNVCTRMFFIHSRMHLTQYCIFNYLICWELYVYNLCLFHFWRGLWKKDWEVKRKLSAPYS